MSESLSIPAMAEPLLAANLAELAEHFASQGEFIVVPDFLSVGRLQGLLDTLPRLGPRVHRNYIPGHKKGGSVSRFELDRFAPEFAQLYRDSQMLEVLRGLSGQPLRHCPPADPHSYALYYYTEPGDHIGFHYDTSYYKGARYTMLLGLVDESSCRLEYELHRKDESRASEAGEVALAPGTMVFFNGDKLWHRITPARAGEQRVALTLEFVTSLDMHPVRRFVSNMKDAIAYFGFRQVFGRSRGH